MFRCFKQVAIDHTVITIIRRKRRETGKTRHRDATLENFTPLLHGNQKEAGLPLQGGLVARQPELYGLAGFPPAVPFISIYVYRTGYVLVFQGKSPSVI